MKRYLIQGFTQQLLVLFEVRNDESMKNLSALLTLWENSHPWGLFTKCLRSVENPLGFEVGSNSNDHLHAWFDEQVRNGIEANSSIDFSYANEAKVHKNDTDDIEKGDY